MRGAPLQTKEAAEVAHDELYARKHEPRPRRYALQTPSGNVVGMGTEKPQLSRQDKRDGWRVIALGQ
jgi:hypothetical protein